MLTPHAWGEGMWGCCLHTAMYLFYQDTGAVGGASSKAKTLDIYGMGWHRLHEPV